MIVMVREIQKLFEIARKIVDLNALRSDSPRTPPSSVGVPYSIDMGCTDCSCFLVANATAPVLYIIEHS